MTTSLASTKPRAVKRVGAASAILAIAACGFDPAYRDVPEPLVATCTAGTVSCQAGALSTCAANGLAWTVTDDCGARGLACAPGVLACTPCLPGTAQCDATNDVTTCTGDGQGFAVTATCDVATGIACRSGACVNLCAAAAADQSNIGCEYWGVDLDNADVSPTLNAAAQQYAIVVSNAEPDLIATVTVQEDDSSPGSAAQIRTVATATILPRNLNVFLLGPREVDGSADGTFNTGTGTALTRHAYRVSSNVPIVAYQFNPLDNVDVFSNDASQLLPTTALGGASGGHTYVVAAWPQTIATSAVPDQNFGTDLRASLAIVGTTPNTHVHIQTNAGVIAGGPFASGLAQGASADVTLQPYEVLNLETGNFDADFTGSFIDSDQPIVVYPGSEASDAPSYGSLADRFCCADHLEQQLTPVRAVGSSYALAHMPNRSQAVAAAGGLITPVTEPEYFRVVAVHSGTTHVTTTLPAPDDAFDLAAEGVDHLMTALQSFTLTASQPVIVGDVQASQEAAGVPDGLPGGDPSLVFPSAVEQWRNDYVLLTPDKYVFDYLVITAPFGAHVYLDGTAVDSTLCAESDGDGLTTTTRGAPNPPYVDFECQLSFPVIDPTQQPPNNILPGRQNDGVHHVQADQPVGIVAYGFDSFVSYAYAGGTQLTAINLK